MKTSFWMEKGWGESLENITLDDVLTAVRETIAMDDEHGAFWIGHTKSEHVMEVDRDLKLFYCDSGNSRDQLTITLSNWQAVEKLYQLFLDEKFDEVKSNILAWTESNNT